MLCQNDGIVKAEKQLKIVLEGSVLCSGLFQFSGLNKFFNQKINQFTLAFRKHKARS